jgi:hypothetical protein
MIFSWNTPAMPEWFYDAHGLYVWMFFQMCANIKYQTKPVSVAFAQGWSRFNAQQRQVMVPGK